jgi:hypothetical protein
LPAVTTTKAAPVHGEAQAGVHWDVTFPAPPISSGYPLTGDAARRRWWRPASAPAPLPAARTCPWRPPDCTGSLMRIEYLPQAAPALRSSHKRHHPERAGPGRWIHFDLRSVLAIRCGPATVLWREPQRAGLWREPQRARWSRGGGGGDANNANETNGANGGDAYASQVHPPRPADLRQGPRQAGWRVAVSVPARAQASLQCKPSQRLQPVAL